VFPDGIFKSLPSRSVEFSLTFGALSDTLSHDFAPTQLRIRACFIVYFLDSPALQISPPSPPLPLIPNFSIRRALCRPSFLPSILPGHDPFLVHVIPSSRFVSHFFNHVVLVVTQRTPQPTLRPTPVFYLFEPLHPSPASLALPGGGPDFFTHFQYH